MAWCSAGFFTYYAAATPQFGHLRPLMLSTEARLSRFECLTEGLSRVELITRGFQVAARGGNSEGFEHFIECGLLVSRVWQIHTACGGVAHWICPASECIHRSKRGR